jgi:hypothetical protein
MSFSHNKRKCMKVARIKIKKREEQKRGERGKWREAEGRVKGRNDEQCKQRKDGRRKRRR